MVRVPIQDDPDPKPAFPTLSPNDARCIRAASDRFEAAWEAGGPAVIAHHLGSAAGLVRHELLSELVRIDMGRRWTAGDRRPVEAYLADWPEVVGNPSVVLSLVRLECALRRRGGETPGVEELRGRFPRLAAAHLEALEQFLLDPPGAARELAHGAGPARDDADTEDARALPARIGRYAVRRRLGSGGFGTVYLAHDEQMDRPVAIKVPSAELLDSEQARNAFLREARSVARLHHEGIVTVYDFGQEATDRCYIVYQFIEGTNLAERMKRGRLPRAAAALVIAQAAEALHHAHLEGLVHRDIKPANILLDLQERPYVADFGLAVRQDERARERGRVTGTPQYMAPEQVRGEGHRIDARTDIFSLGVVLYELLCGRRPFIARSLEDLYDQVEHQEARPPRTIDDAIPRELERICLKAISKRMTDRYTTAADMAQELRGAVASGGSALGASVPPGLAAPGGAVAMAVSTPGAGTEATPRDSRAAPRVVPKGLRSFGPEDADFFVELLPGPRDAAGLPDSIRFWKTRIEPVDADSTFPVGLIYGPSGCGKSSLVRAGLLPHLAAHVRAAYAEATRDGTEARVRAALQRVCADLEPEAAIEDAIAALRRGAALPPQQKLLLVIDQFEQWLHTTGPSLTATPLFAALRQADGLRVQVLLLVRDDFWLAASRLFEELEVPLVGGQNVGMVDLFDTRHARRVLSLFGRAYGCLPERTAEFTREQNRFLDQAVEGLSQAGKVISVRLSLFADMMKGRPWTPASLEAVGGTEGVGVTFLEETFSGATASPDCRLHEPSIRGVLGALLPEAGSDIRGRMRSADELLRASGLEGQRQRFDRVLAILDRELRIITPIDAPDLAESARATAGATRWSPDAGATGAGRPSFYQLTHDYLIPPLRLWLTRKKRETWRGRAALQLEQRTAEWSRRRDRRLLPNPVEYLTILAAVPRPSRTASERALLRACARRHGTAAGLLAATLLIAAWGARELNGRLEAQGLVRAVQNASIDQLPALVNQLTPYHRWARGPLERLRSQSDPVAQLHAALALLPHDRMQVGYLHQRLLECRIEQLPVIRVALEPYAAELRAPLWSLARDPAAEPAARFNAALALARYDPQSPEWTDGVTAFVVDRLLRSSVDFQAEYRSALEPIRARLVPATLAAASDPARDDTERLLAATALADFARDDAGVLTEALVTANSRQFPILLDALRPSAEAVTPMLVKRLESDAGGVPAAGDEAGKDQLARRRAQTSLAMLHLGGHEAAWDLLRHDGDPRARTYWLHQLRATGLPGRLVAERFLASNDPRDLFGLLEALGEYTPQALPEPLRRLVEQQARALARSNRRRDLHAAAGWLLRRWDGAAGPQEDANEHEARAGNAEWFRNAEGSTMVVVPAGRFAMGSPDTDPDREPDETRHAVTITRPFAIADRLVTVEQFSRFYHAVYGKEYAEFEQWNVAGENVPVVGPTWFEAVAYCRWLSDCEGIDTERNCYPTLDRIMAAGRQSAGDRLASLELPEDFLARPGYRLPTEAEWEYACRAGATTRYSFGNDAAMLVHFGWFLGNSARGGRPGRTWAVGSLKPNDWGLFDMHGNVFEWVWDWQGPYSGDAGDPTGPSSGSVRVVRGGGWNDHAAYCRSANRGNYQPANRLANIGFRVARGLSEIP